MNQPAPNGDSFWSLPDGRVARWAAGLAALTLLCFAALLLMSYTGHRFKPLILVFFLIGPAALATSIASIVRERERGVVVWASLVVGTLATLLMVAEFTVME